MSETLPNRPQFDNFFLLQSSVYYIYFGFLDLLKQEYVSSELEITISRQYDLGNQKLFNNRFKVTIVDVTLNYEEECFTFNVEGSFENEEGDTFNAEKIIFYFNAEVGIELNSTSSDRTYCFLSNNQDLIE